MVNAETARYIYRTKGTAAVRSPFRLGEMRFQEDGIVLDGLETQPIRWLKNLGIVCGIIFYISANGLRSTIRPLFRAGYGWWMLLPLVTGIIAAVATIVNERRRGPVTQLVLWNHIRELNTDPKLRWTTFVYEVPSENPKKKPAVYTLSLNKLEPATIGGIVNTVAHLAPQVVLRDKASYQWTRARLLTLAFATLILIATITFLVFKINATP